MFTNITHDHLDYHVNFDNYFIAKKKLFDQLHANAFALLNADDGISRWVGIAAEKITFGLNALADEKARIIENQLQGLQLHINGQELYSRLVGSFNASNLLAAYCATTKLGFDPLETLTSMSLLTPPAGRFELVESASGITGIVDYAHTPDALENVLKTIAAIRTGDEKEITELAVEATEIKVSAQ